MLKARVTTVGNSTGIVLPKEVLSKLDVEKGDSLILTETEHGFQISAEDPEFELQMEGVRDLMKRYRNTLRELAK